MEVRQLGQRMWDTFSIENARPLSYPSNGGGAASEMQKINECVSPFPPATHRREKAGQVPPGFGRKTGLGSDSWLNNRLPFVVRLREKHLNKGLGRLGNRGPQQVKM